MIMLKRIVLIGIAVALCGSGAWSFTDVPSDHWAYPYVEKLVTEYQVISGYPDNTYRGEKTLNRYEFSKALVAALSYIETTREVNLKAETTKEVKFKDVKTTHWAYPYLMDLVSKYQIITGFPDGTFKGQRTLNRNEVSVAVAKALGRVEEAAGSPVKLKEVTLTDLPPDHWAYPSVQKLISAGIINPFEDGSFQGKKDVSRYLLAYILARFIDFSLQKLERVEVLPPSKLVERSLEISSRPMAYVSGGMGNIYENNSGTNNWMGFNASACYGNIFRLWRFSGNYEISGKYGFNQIYYMVPSGGGGVSGSVVNENRYELELNTIHPIVKFYGIDGKLLLGLKYINLSNPTAPTDFTGLNLGAATAAQIYGRDVLIRAFYSLPLARVNVTPSVLGQPSQLFDYEASINARLLSYPVLLGLSGEIMTLSGGSARFYNMFFVRYFLI